MPRLRILALAGKEERTFLEDYFSDTRSNFVPLAVSEEPAAHFHPVPDFLFYEPSLLPPPALKAVQALKTTRRFAFEREVPDSIKDASAISIVLPLAVGPLEEAVFGSVPFANEIRVLLVDDEPELCAGLKDYLESRASLRPASRRCPAFRVEYALNGLEAFRKLETFRPDVTIMDLKMPVKSGHDFYREASRRYPDFRAIVLTSSLGPEEISQIRTSGTPPVVEKGSCRSSYPEMVSLILKTWLFS